jgi:hypothetical protein
VSSAAEPAKRSGVKRVMMVLSRTETSRPMKWPSREAVAQTVRPR